MLNGNDDDEHESRFEADYKIIKLLYNGTFSSVYECECRETKQKYAVKVVDVPRFLTVYSKEQLANETKIAQLLLTPSNDPNSPPKPHPQLVTTLDSRSEFSKYYMIYERLHHRDICFEIEHRASSFIYGEHIARHYMRQILEAVGYMHAKSVIHRDLKISCVLLGRSDQIKIGGFSSAVLLPDKGYIQETQNQMGTVHYMSPEVVRCEYYGRPVDVWGCGILLYVLLTGSLPFSGKTSDVCKRVLAPPDFTSERWSEVSQIAKQLCQSMLTTDQYKRTTIDEALQHPWIQGQISRSPLKRAVEEMCSFNVRRKMQSAISVACNSPLWDTFRLSTSDKHSHSSVPVVDPSLDCKQAKEMLRVVSNAVVSVQDSVEEAHMLQQDPKYISDPSVVHDSRLTTLLKLYDKISVDLASSLGKNNMSIVSNEKGEVGAFKLCAEIASILDHQLSTSQSFTPHDSAHLRDLLLSYNFNCLLRAHDVIIAELFDSQSNSSSPLGADSRGTAGAQMEGTTTASSSSPMPMTITLSKQHSAVMHHHSSHHVNNSTTPNGNCVETSLGVSPLSSPQLTSLHPHPEVTRVKQVNFHRNKGEPLGITLKILKTDQVVVSRVMIGGMIHRQKILNEGDEILEINGRSIRRHSEEELRELLNNISGDIVIKVTPKNNPSAGAIDNLSESFFVRAMFDYRPEEDTTSQAAAAFGLAFHARDILQILKHKTSEPDYSVSVQSSMHELHHRQNPGGTFGSAMGITENQRWWQARIVCRADDSLTSSVVDDFNFDLDITSRPTLHGAIGNGGGGGSAAAARKIGLVPSCLWRMEMIKNEKISGDKIRSSCGGFFTRKKKKINVIELNEDEIYERVVQLKEPLPRKSLLLVGAPGVGRRSIKNALIHVDHRFAYPKPHTSKPVDSEAVDEAGNSLYHHVPHHELVAAANRGEYLEVGKYNDAWFGTKFHTIDRIISSDLIPVLDIEPDSIKKLRNSKYMPYVVFVDAPRNFNSSNSSSPDDASIVQSFEQLLHVSMEIDRHYRALFDVTIENKSLDRTVELIRAAFDRVCTSANEWVPLNWVVTSENHHQYHTQTTSINTLPHHSTIS